MAGAVVLTRVLTTLLFGVAADRRADVPRGVDGARCGRRCGVPDSGTPGRVGRPHGRAARELISDSGPVARSRGTTACCMVQGHHSGPRSTGRSPGQRPRSPFGLASGAGTLTAQSLPVKVRLAGLALTIAYSGLIVWLYASQPQTVAQVTGGLASGAGLYRVDAQATADALAFFRRNAFPEARAAFARADPAQRDAQTQFYIAYSYYREGWGRLYSDDALFKQGLEAIDRAIALAPAHRLVVDDPDLLMKSADEVKAELERGLTRDASDLNPLKVFRTRK